MALGLGLRRRFKAALALMVQRRFEWIGLLIILIIIVSLVWYFVHNERGTPPPQRDANLNCSWKKNVTLLSSETENHADATDYGVSPCNIISVSLIKVLVFVLYYITYHRLIKD